MGYMGRRAAWCKALHRKASCAVEQKRRVFKVLVRQARQDAAVKLAAWRGRPVCESGQGTTEYAILVGVLVVIAILAITLFRTRLQELWTAISDGINSL